FSGALDRPSTLQRRLKTMLVNPNPRRRTAGKALIVAALALALPLTATWATKYIDVPATPVSPVAPVAPKAPHAPLAAFAPEAPHAPHAPNPPAEPAKGDRIMVHGEKKDWNDLTPQERAEIRRSIAQARAEMAKVDTAAIQRDIDKAMAEVRVDRAGMAHEMASARAEIAEAMREIDANADEIRKAGQDPETIKATVRASLKAVEAIDIDAITRNALASVDRKTIEASMEAARAGMRQAEAELERLDRKTRK
ncbi:MAG: hypothetical protein ABI667_00545, partial [Sphingomicrobium sp.]